MDWVATREGGVEEEDIEVLLEVDTDWESLKEVEPETGRETVDSGSDGSNFGRSVSYLLSIIDDAGFLDDGIFNFSSSIALIFVFFTSFSEDFLSDTITPLTSAPVCCKSRLLIRLM